MKASTLGPLITGLIVAIIWGYFSDLRDGDTQSFVIRIIIVPLFVLIISKLSEKR